MQFCRIIFIWINFTLLFFFFFFANKDVLNKGHGIMMHDLLQPTSYRYNRPHRQVTKSEGGIIHIFYSLKILKYM